MSGTDPDAGRPIDRTQAYRPDEAQTPAKQPDNLPKVPGITLHFELARGGMGVVFSGRQDFLDRRVAVKLLSVELGGESFVQRFQREAKILAGIKHPNIVACHMAGQTDLGQSYLVMEFIDGPSLKKWITDHGPVPIKAALRTTRAVAQALGHAHTLGIIHRDVKAENILLETVTSTALDISFPFIPKVVDLGLARASSGNASLGLTSPGSVMGTPATMSPEQYDEPDAVDFRTDIYGLGCVLYEMLVGQPAFRGKRLSDIVTKKRELLAPDPCSENPEIPSAVGLLVQEMLATNREDRPSSYRLLDERLAALIDVTANVPTKPKPKPIVGDETGHTVLAIKDKTGQPPEKGKAGDKSKEPSGPGLLRTAEINFLAEGLGEVGAAKNKPVFEDGEQGKDSPFAVTKAPQDPTGQRASQSGAQNVAKGGTRVESRADEPKPKSRTALVVGAVVGVLALAGVAWLVLQPKDGGGGGGGPVTTNKPPTIASIVPVAGLAEGRADLGRRFTLKATASDPEGAKPLYTWSTKSELLVGRPPFDQDTASFEFLEGLPGVEAEIELVVSDGSAMTPHVHTVVCGECEITQPLIGFKNSGRWQRDSADIAWVDTRDDEGTISCTANNEYRTLSGALGDEPYWEYFGSLESSDTPVGPQGDTVVFAELGGRFEFGGRSYCVVCKRSGKDGAQWSIEFTTATRTGNTWKLEALDPPLKHAFTPPTDSDDEPRASFSVQRRGRELFVRLGEARKPPEDGAKEIVEWKVDRPIPLLNPAPGALVWFVDKGIGRFRVKHR